MGRLGRAAEAVEALARAAELEPRDHRRRLRLAFAGRPTFTPGWGTPG